MELGSIFTDYAAQRSDLITLSWMFLVVFTVVVGVVTFVLVKYIAKRDEDADLSVVCGISFLLWVIISISFLFVTNNHMSTTQALEASEKISTEVEEHYGVVIPAEKILEAWNSGEDDVTLVNAEHDGARKSLGVSVNEDNNTLTVFQGNVELEPVR